MALHLLKAIIDLSLAAWRRASESLFWSCFIQTRTFLNFRIPNPIFQYKRAVSNKRAPLRCIEKNKQAAQMARTPLRKRTLKGTFRYHIYCDIMVF